MKKIARNVWTYVVYHFSPIWKFIFVTFPMVYILYTYWISFHGHNPVQAAGGLLVTFGAFAYVHARYMRRDHYAAKLRLQVILANVSLEATLFAIAMSCTHYQIGSAALNTLMFIASGVAFLFIYVAIISDYEEEDIYKLFTTVFIIFFAVFFIYQVVLLWMTWYVFIPALTGSIMISTIYRNGIVHDKGKLPFMIFFTIPLMFGIGIISLILQYFFYKILGVELWGLLIGILLLIYIMWRLNRSEMKLKKDWAEIDGNEVVR